MICVLWTVICVLPVGSEVTGGNRPESRTDLGLNEMVSWKMKSGGYTAECEWASCSSTESTQTLQSSERAQECEALP